MKQPGSALVAVPGKAGGVTRETYEVFTWYRPLIIHLTHIERDANTALPVTSRIG